MTLVPDLTLRDHDTLAFCEGGFEIGGGLDSFGSKVIILMILQTHRRPDGELVGRPVQQLFITRRAGKEYLLEQMTTLFEDFAYGWPIRLRVDPAIELIRKSWPGVAFRQPLPEHQDVILINAVDFTGTACSENPPIHTGAVMAGCFKTPFAYMKLDQAGIFAIEAVPVSCAGNRACQQDLDVRLLFKVRLDDVAILRDDDQDGFGIDVLQRWLESIRIRRGFRQQNRSLPPAVLNDLFDIVHEVISAAVAGTEKGVLEVAPEVLLRERRQAVFRGKITGRQRAGYIGLVTMDFSYGRIGIVATGEGGDEVLGILRSLRQSIQFLDQGTKDQILEGGLALDGGDYGSLDDFLGQFDGGFHGGLFIGMAQGQRLDRMLQVPFRSNES